MLMSQCLLPLQRRADYRGRASRVPRGKPPKTNHHTDRGNFVDADLPRRVLFSKNGRRVVFTQPSPLVSAVDEQTL